jgi:hypothetical protein
MIASSGILFDTDKVFMKPGIYPALWKWFLFKFLFKLIFWNYQKF